MANNPGAKKAIRKIAQRTEVNKARRSRVRTFLRKFEEAVAGGDAALAKDAFVSRPVGAHEGRRQGRGARQHGLAKSVQITPSTEEDGRCLSVLTLSY